MTTLAPMQHLTVTIFGGTGFLGRYVVAELARAGARIRIITRNPDAAKELKTFGNVGQIVLEKGNMRDFTNLARLVEGSDIVINLVGILFEKGSQRFAGLHAQGAEKLAQAARQAGVSRFIHVSALGVDKAAKSSYARSKLAGEKAVLSAFASATILRPSVIFGPEDNFLNRFAEMAALSPVLPLVDGGKTRFQPVYVVDVARAIRTIIGRSETTGQTYELGGPQTYSFRQLLLWLAGETGQQRCLLSLPSLLMRPLAKLLECLPTPPLTADQITLLESDNILTGDHPGLNQLGIHPTAMEAVAPAYLERFRKGGRFATTA